MAITGTKAFTSGEILTSNDVNQYLMRGVKVFSSTAVRDAAYGGAGEPVLEQGEAAFLTDTNTLQVYGGTALGWLPYRRATAGQVLQVVSTTKTDTFTSTSQTYVDVTGLSVAITPSATSSKVLLIASVATGAQAGITLRINGGNATTYVGDAAGNRVRGVASQWEATVTSGLAMSLVYLDSPATTSATTYQVQALSMNPANAIYVNRSHQDTNTTEYARTASTITALEISA